MSKNLTFQWTGLLEQPSKKLRRIDPVRGVVRASINTTWLGVVMAQIAGCRLQTGARDFPPRMRRIVQFDRERVKVDIAVGAIVRAQSTTNAPVFDDDFEGISAPD